MAYPRTVEVLRDVTAVQRAAAQVQRQNYWAYVKEVAEGGHRLTVEIRKMVRDCVRYGSEVEPPDCANDYGLLRGS